MPRGTRRAALTGVAAQTAVDMARVGLMRDADDVSLESGEEK
jgi:hypothetical protein